MHARRDLSDCAKLLALKLFNDYSNHISTKVLLKTQFPHSHFVDPDEPAMFSGLHCVSMFGIVEMVASLAGVEGCDINQEDCLGNPPLMWAARNGHEGVVKTLLELGDVNPDKPGNYDRTPLWWAALNGHEGVAKILLGRDDVNPQKPDNNDQTPISCAAENGHGRVVKILLERDNVNPSVRKRPVRSGLGLGRPAWAFFAAGRAGLWATVRLSGPI